MKESRVNGPSITELGFMDWSQVEPNNPAMFHWVLRVRNPHQISRAGRPAATTWAKAEREIGSAADAETETTPSDPSATDASSLASSSTPKPPPIPNGFLASEIGSAPVASTGSVDLDGVVFVELEF
uniref:Uncharacterized protein n=1 Tax=Vitis vinifera TaxID=29760 RepID=A5B5L5_VITVI|nr:hypothetical protein VITISV_020467 [Vitis vinifera]